MFLTSSAQFPSGKGAVYLVALLSMAFFAPGAIPAPWLEADVNAPGQPGSSTYDPVNANWVVTGGGDDIWNAADKFHYDYISVTGDCVITARGASLTDGAGGATNDQWSKAGVMIRDGTAGGAMYAFECITGNNGTAYQYRLTTGAGAGTVGQTGGAALHRWVRMIRTGNSFQGAYSDDGTTWTNQGGAQTIAMPATALVGLACCAHNDGTTATATFDSLTVTNGTGGVIWPLSPPVVASPPTAGYNAITLNWGAVTNAVTYNILRSPTTGGPYTQIATVNAPTTTYTDTTVSYPNTYFYVVTASAPSIGTSAYSNEVSTTPLQPPVTATPNTGLQTSEAGASTTFTIKYNVAQAGVSRLTVTSSDTTEGTVAANGLTTVAVPGGFYYDVPAGTTPSIVVTVTGVDDALVDGNIAYQIDITAGGVSVPIPSVQCTNIDDDVQGLVFSRTAGLMTTESGGQDSFSVTLTRQPFNNVSFTLMSSNTAEGTVAPGSLTFTNLTGDPYNPGTGVGGWNVPHTVTVTGVDDTVLDFTIPYTIVTGALSFVDTNDQNAFTAAGVTAAPDVACVNLDNEVPPALDHVWGSGCGLLGGEIALPWVLALFLRRRRRKL